jgi:hypothetical protein
MRLQSHRRNLLSNLSTPAGESRATRPVRSRRLRWWLRSGALLSVIGIRRLARTRWQPIFLVTDALVFVIGLTLRNSVAFVSGILMMGSAASDTAPHSPNAAIVHTWMWLHKSRTGNP